MTKKLEPCPHCGGTGAGVVDHRGYYSVRCGYWADNSNKDQCFQDWGEFETEEEAITAWNRRAATEGNDPLTLEELRGMDGEPVWIKNLGGTDVRDSGWAGIAFEMFYGTYVYWLWNDFEDNPKNENYGKTWIAYRRPPEGGEGR